MKSMTMVGAIRIHLLLALASLWLAADAAESTAVQHHASALRAQRARVHASSNRARSSLRKDDHDDDEDEDAEDEEEEDKEDEGEEDTSDPRRSAVVKAHTALYKNLKGRVKLGMEMRALEAEEAGQDIDAAAKAITNETQSAAIGSLVGDMWKDMRMFAEPLYKAHLKEELGTLERMHPGQQREYERAKAALPAEEPSDEAKDDA
uniref:Uncharacterized protein n=1 Tax=Strombidinopsis acuminata TaxID=141414 RepID=A0A7S3U4T4_9SPIT|mmetsp:Transcript_9328/g.24065  ORF Transcript_9328/g.24065 Transcript_9328/m.24065 type:complete len:206 (-) Transcript_9328:140-757(-)